MRKQSFDSVVRVRTRRQPGQFAAVAGAVAAEKGLLGDILTIRMGEDDTVRDVTVEAEDDAHLARIVAAIRAVAGVEVMQVIDPVFETHRGGKLHMTSRVRLERLQDLRHVYTPGVARVVRAIEREPERAREWTGLGNSVGIFTNGTRVLGLGNVGPLASLPVMEGKAVLYDAFAGISAVPMLVDTTDPDEFIETVVRLAPSFGGIHLEDIRVPDCFRIESELIRRLSRPVMHDDQHGTAVAALAAVINACVRTGLSLKAATLGQIGLGAAGSAIARLAGAYGVGRVLVTDVDTTAMARAQAEGAEPCDLPTLLATADIVIATTGRPGLIRPQDVRPGQVIFSLSNPEPEIDPAEALAAGAALAFDGRSINNALAFPGLFKAALEVQSRSISREMMVAAAEAIAAWAGPDEVVPSPLDLGVHGAVTRAVAACARQQGLAGTARLQGSAPLA